MKNKNILENLAAVTAGKVKTSGVSAFNELEISKVFPNPDQPRKQFDDIEELAATIKEHGLLQPITVVKKDDRYMIIAGERRYKAHLHNEAKTIKAYIVDVSEEQVEELTLIENIQRNDLTDFELAKHICKLWDSGRYEKKSDLATRIGKSDSYVSKSFNCLKLDSEIIDHIEQNKTPISIGVMDEIARVKDQVVQKEVYEKYSAGEITRDDIKDFKPKKEKRYDDVVFEVLEEKIDNFKNPPISCSYVEENFPWEKSFSEQYFYVRNWEIKLTKLMEDGYKQPFKEMKINNAYEQKIHDLLLEKSPKEVDSHVGMINLCASRNGYKKSEDKTIYLYSNGCNVRLLNRYDEIIFDLLKENLELKKELEELKNISSS